jgi:hypothetical protein
MDVVVDNRSGGDDELAAALTRELRERGIEVELREAAAPSPFDTAVHLISTGLVVRVSERPDPRSRAVVEAAIRAALAHRTSLRRRTRAVPVHLGESARVLAWVDLFD